MRVKLKARASKKLTKRRIKAITISFRRLRTHNVRHEAKLELEKGAFLKSVKRFCRSSLRGYEHYWRRLLWAAEWQDAKNLKLYDMEDSYLSRYVVEPGSSTTDDDGSKGRQNLDNQWISEVPDLEQGRPSVLVGVQVMVTWTGKRLWEQ